MLLGAGKHANEYGESRLDKEAPSDEGSLARSRSVDCETRGERADRGAGDGAPHEKQTSEHMSEATLSEHVDALARRDDVRG